MQVAVFQLSLANGHNRTSVIAGVFALGVSIPSQIVLISVYGVIGAAIPWAVINVLAYVLLGFILNRKFYSGSIQSWFWSFGIRPVFTVFFFIYMLSRLFINEAYGFWLLTKLSLIAVLTLIIAVWASPAKLFTVSWIRGD
jgi:peptidoglycan biosynthesis protein MviN/MurJ (putative lipid II flippase)